MADFAAARERVNSRRVASTSLPDPVETHTRLSKLPPSLQHLTFELSRYWSVIRSPFGTNPAFRVGQVDSELLDEDLLELLGKQVAEGLKFFGNNLKDDWGAEIDLGLRLALWKVSLWDHGASYGSAIQGLKYVDARSKESRNATAGQRVAHGLITVVGRYTWKRWEDFLSSRDGGGYDLPSARIQRLSRLTNILNTSYDVSSFISFLVFLYNGRYRTLTDRLLYMKLVPATNQTSRELSFDWLNRQLVWKAFTEFLLFLLPLVGIQRSRKWANVVWRKLLQLWTRLRQGRKTRQEDEEHEHHGQLAFLPDTTCAICYHDQNPSTTGRSEQDVISASANSGIIGSASTDITNPYEAIPCGCVYCYVCLAQRIEAEEGDGFNCLRCGEMAVKSCKPWSGDVTIESRIKTYQRATEVPESIIRPPSRTSKKSVAFADDHQAREYTNPSSTIGSELSEPLSAVDPMPVEETEHSRWSHFDDDGEDAEDD